MVPHAMVDAFRRLFGGTDAGAPAPDAEAAAAGAGASPVQVAACGLLLTIAHADDEFSPEERERIEGALERHFGLAADERAELLAVAEAERRRAVDDFHFTRVINEHYDLGQKMLLAELMWGIILADGEVAKHESYLVRKLANLLDLAPAYLSQARKRATPED